jgi:predicted metal-dependent hydrolase
MNMKLSALLLPVCLGFSSLSVGAAETTFQQFHQLQNQAYASYRVALSQTNKKDQAASLKGIDAFSKQWQLVIEQFADNPPEVFANDESWKPTLIKVADIAKQGKSEIKKGELAEAHEVLEAIRDELSSLRSRNHVTFFSDRINSYHEVMEHLLQAKYSKDNIDDTAKQTIGEQLAILNFLAQDIVENAPEEYQNNDSYKKLQQGLIKSLATLREALDSNDPAAISKAVSGLKPAYAKLFVKFG